MTTKKRPHRPKLYHLWAGEPGHWRWKLNEMARMRGYVHISGPWQGKVNLYRLARETGLRERALRRIQLQFQGRVGMPILGRLCDVLNCQPGDLIERVPGPVRHVPDVHPYDEWELPGEWDEPDHAP